MTGPSGDQGDIREAPAQKLEASDARKTMTFLGAAVLVAMLAGAAWAAPGSLVTAPAGWRADPEQATSLAQRFAATTQFGGVLTATATAAEAYVADRPGVALFATRATAALSDPAQAAIAARFALDDLRATSQRAALADGAAAKPWLQENTDAQDHAVSATLRWTDRLSHALAGARVVVASDGARIVAVTGECFASDTADPVRVEACRAALASLDTGIPAQNRIALAPAAPAQTRATSELQPQMRAAPSPADREAPRLDDGSRMPLPPITIPQEPRGDDRRMFYLGAGVLLLAVLFWWNRKQRDRFDREDRDEPTPRRRATDDDADDLHAAARGDGSDRPDKGTP
jgi:hypothetical protein